MNLAQGMENDPDRQTHTDRKETSGRSGLGAEEIGVTTDGYWGSFWDHEMF